ncbi:acyl-CoA N-acyltransferase [Flagelloscypha sp. PMI_526]|nr:acyl-CoA N-acyltransferase [Flagelloscypha sp. PMI_526]
MAASVSCRLYQQSDYAAVVRLFTRANYGGRGSLFEVAFHYFCARSFLPSLALALPGYFFRTRTFGKIVFTLGCVGIITTVFLVSFLRWLLYRHVCNGVATDIGVIASRYHHTCSSGVGTVEAATPSGFWVAVLNAGTESEKVVGSVGLEYNSETEIGNLRRLAVDEEFRQLGIGRRLVDTLLEHAAQRGVCTVTLETSQFQPAAVAFYSRCGFEVERVILKALIPGLEFRIYHYRKVLKSVD